MASQSIFINSSGKKIHALKSGSGSTHLHFLHANGLCAGTYTPFTDLFSENFTTVATDIPGHGDSDDHGEDVILHWEIFIDHIKESIVQNLKPPVIGVGHSLGAVVTYITAARYPELFSKIILIDPVILPKRKLFIFSIAKKLGLEDRLNPLATGARRRINRFESRNAAYSRFSSGKGMFKSWEDEFISSYSLHGLKEEKDSGVILKCQPETEAQIYESILMDIWTYPKKIKSPTLLIRGEKTDTFDKNAAKRLVREIKNCRLETIDSAGHFVPMEEPRLCHKIIQDFALK